MCRISNAGDWKLFTGVPVTGIIKSDDGSSAVQLSSYYKDDRRIEKGDEHYAAAGPSYYAATTVQTYKPAVFIFDVEEDGLLLQAVDCINSVPVTPGLCAHSAIPEYIPRLVSAAHMQFTPPLCMGPSCKPTVDTFLGVIRSEIVPDARAMLDVLDAVQVCGSTQYFRVGPEVPRICEGDGSA